MNNQTNAAVAPRDTDARGPRRTSTLSSPSTEFGVRLTAVKRAKTPLLEAARPLLRALADMPEYLEAVAVAGFRSLLAQELRGFPKLCEQANIRPDPCIDA